MIKADVRNRIIAAIMMSAFFSIILGGLYYIATGTPLFGAIVGSFLASLSVFILISNLDRQTAYIVMIIFFLKYGLTIYQAIYKNLPLGGEDWWNYHVGAQTILNSGSNFIYIFFGNSYDLFTKLVAFIYFCFGIHTMQINLYVLASSFVAALFLYKTAIVLTDGDFEASNKTLVVFLLWPLDIVYSVTYLREMPIQMLCIISFYYFIKYIKSHQIRQFVLAFIFIALACMMHSGVIGIILVYFMFFRLGENTSTKNIFNAKNLAIAAIFLVLLMASPLWSSISAKLGNISTAEDVVERVGQFTEEDASTRYVSEMPTNIVMLILQILPRAALFAVVPLPWMINSVSTAIAWLIDAVPQIWIIGRMISLFKDSNNNIRIRFYTSLALCCMISEYIVCGMGTTAYGNAIRHRAKILPIILVFVIAVYDHMKKEEIR